MVAFRELFLRKNNISDIQELQYLSGLQHLHVLWLAENPVTATPNCEQRPDASCVPLCMSTKILRDASPSARFIFAHF
jgi:hypothetical protein